MAYGQQFAYRAASMQICHHEQVLTRTNILALERFTIKTAFTLPLSRLNLTFTHRNNRIQTLVESQSIYFDTYLNLQSDQNCIILKHFRGGYKREI